MSCLLHKIISGGQTGADQGGLDFGMETGIPIGGYGPKGFICENGRIPNIYPLKEVKSNDYNERTRLNVMHSDGTFIFIGNDFMEEGSWITVRECIQNNKPYAIIEVSEFNYSSNERDLLLSWLKKNQIRILNIAGNRESNYLGIQNLTKRILHFLFFKDNIRK